jgi:hypothetical protein
MSKADDRAGEREQCQMDIDSAFETGAHLAHAREPGMSALHHPAMSPQPVIALDPFARDAGR